MTSFSIYFDHDAMNGYKYRIRYLPKEIYLYFKRFCAYSYNRYQRGIGCVRENFNSFSKRLSAYSYDIYQQGIGYAKGQIDLFSMRFKEFLFFLCVKAETYCKETIYPFLSYYAAQIWDLSIKGLVYILPKMGILTFHLLDFIIKRIYYAAGIEVPPEADFLTLGGELMLNKFEKLYWALIEKIGENKFKTCVYLFAFMVYMIFRDFFL